MPRSPEWSRLPGAIARIAAARDDVLREVVVSAFQETLAAPARIEPVEPYRGLSFELSDGGELFGHVVLNPPPADPDGLQPIGEILARFAAARLEAARLRREATQFRSVVDSADFALTVADANRRTLYANAAVHKITGYTIEELNRVPASERIHPADRERVEEARKANLDGQSTRIRWRAIRKDGKVTWIESSARPVREKDGKVSIIVLSSRDITAEVEAIEHSRRVEERHRVIAELTPAAHFCAVLAPDNTATLDWIAGQVEGITRLPSVKDLEGRNWMGEVHANDLLTLPEFYAKLRAGESAVWDHRMASAEHGFVWRRAIARVVPDDTLPEGHLRVYGVTFSLAEKSHGDETCDEEWTRAE